MGLSLILDIVYIATINSNTDKYSSFTGIWSMIVPETIYIPPVIHILFLYFGYTLIPSGKSGNSNNGNNGNNRSK